MWEYLDNSWRRAPATALLDSAPVPQRAPAPTPRSAAFAPAIAASAPRSTSIVISPLLSMGLQYRDPL